MSGQVDEQAHRRFRGMRGSTGLARPQSVRAGAGGRGDGGADASPAHGPDERTDISRLVAEAFLYGPVSEDQRALVHQVVDIGLGFLEGSTRQERPLLHLDADQLRGIASSDLPLGGAPASALVDAARELATYSVAQCDPCYLAFPDTGNSLAGLLGDLLAACLNQNMIAVDRSAPLGSYLEAQLILWLRELVGFSTYRLDELPSLAALGGMWTSGGNMSNHVAIAGALQHRFPEVGHSGLVGLAKRPVIVLAQGVEHFSYASAAQVLGLGRDALLWCPPSPDFTTDPDALAEALATTPEGTEPFMVVAVAGNCRTTSLDDLRQIANVCERAGVWLHVDACHGGSLLFSKRLGRHLDGIERADSVSLDPHKGLFTTYACSFVLFRDPSVLARFARYPARVQEPECLDLGLVTPFYGSRRFESLKLWMLIKHLGVEGLGRLVEARQDTFMDLAHLLADTGYFTLLNDPTFYRLVFVFLPPDLGRELRRRAVTEQERERARHLIDDFTIRFSDRLYRDGRVVFDQFSVQDLGDRLGFGASHKYQVMGLAVGHPVISENRRWMVRQVVEELAADLAVEMGRALEGLAPLEPTDRAGTSGPAGW